MRNRFFNISFVLVIASLIAGAFGQGTIGMVLVLLGLGFYGIYYLAGSLDDLS